MSTPGRPATNPEWQLSSRTGKPGRSCAHLKSGAYLNVFVSGQPLDPKVHGTPPEYSVVAASGVAEIDSFYLTDANWSQGVARRWAGFFVPRGTPGYAVGRRIKLKNGEFRTITRLDESGKYLNVYLDGKPLDPIVHGTPPEIALVP